MKKPVNRTAALDLTDETSSHNATTSLGSKLEGAMIHLYLVRHAKADGQIGNVSRTLSDKGRKRFHKTARTLARHCKRLDLILTSSLVRAVQTAEVLASETKHGEVEVLEELSPEHSANELLIAVAAKIKGHRSVALVGHKPSLVQALAQLAGGGDDLDFHNGAIVRIDVSALPQPELCRPRWWIAASSAKKHKGLPRRESHRDLKTRGKLRRSTVEPIKADA